MTATIYVYMPEEAVDAWRPVEATHLGGSVHRIIGPIPDAEAWEFQPGESVRCAERAFESGNKGLVAMERESVGQ